MSNSVSNAAITAHAPARVNLLGEHTDYSGGYVLPIAIAYYTTVKLSPSEDGVYTFRSEMFAEQAAGSIVELNTARKQWSDYPVGVLQELAKLQLQPKPFALHLSGNVPLGAGLSSSASVEVASCVAMLRAGGNGLAAGPLALLCQRAENDFVGSPCGIMDQFVVTAARAGRALMLNTRDLTYELLPIDSGSLSEMCLLACNSMVKHSIAAGDYGSRRKGVEEGQQVLRHAYPGLRDLGDATLQQLEAQRDKMSPDAYKRCHHVISENARVMEAKQAMLDGNAARFGELMLASHTSQRDDFECSCEEIDFLVERASTLPGCTGARLTGGGFGGCTVNLVRRDQAESFSTALTEAYKARFNITPEIYPCDPVDGALALAAKENA